MKIGMMVRDVLRSLLRRPVTRQYPFTRTNAPESLRGKLCWEPQKCTGCLLCVKDCPADAIEVIMVDKANKRFAMHYHLDRCTFCSQCVISCRTGALKMSNSEWELAAANKDTFELWYGNNEDVQRMVESTTSIPSSTQGQ